MPPALTLMPATNLSVLYHFLHQDEEGNRDGEDAEVVHEVVVEQQILLDDADGDDEDRDEHLQEQQDAERDVRRL